MRPPVPAPLAYSADGGFISALSSDYGAERVRQEMRQMQIKLQNQIDNFRSEANNLKYQNAQSNNDLQRMVQNLAY